MKKCLNLAIARLCVYDLPDKIAQELIAYLQERKNSKIRKRLGKDFATALKCLKKTYEKKSQEKGCYSVYHLIRCGLEKSPTNLSNRIINHAKKCITCRILLQTAQILKALPDIKEYKKRCKCSSKLCKSK